ncbi:MAG: hypothetical protein ACJ8H8_27710, partial [Geminicoccaceae bacterium]
AEQSAVSNISGRSLDGHRGDELAAGEDIQFAVSTGKMVADGLSGDNNARAMLQLYTFSNGGRRAACRRD